MAAIPPSFSPSLPSPVGSALARQIEAASNAAPTSSTSVVLINDFPERQVVAYLLATPFFVSLPSFSSASVTGGIAVPVAQLILSGSGDSYTTAGTGVSTVVVADVQSAAVFGGSGVGATIVNATPGAALLIATGSTNQVGNTLEGLAGANQFVTGMGGRDAVLLDGAANNLTSNGNDVVLVGGPSTITAASSGVDAVTITSGTTLAFVNQSTAGTTDSITGAANSLVLLAGPGNTAITAGPGTEYDFVDTSAGNTTINANGNGVDLLTLIKNYDGATENVQVNNFTASDVVALHGYSGFNVSTLSFLNPVSATSFTTGSLLQLSDGSRVAFNNVSAAVLQSLIRTV